MVLVEMIIAIFSQCNPPETPPITQMKKEEVLLPIDNTKQSQCLTGEMIVALQAEAAPQEEIALNISKLTKSSRDPTKSFRPGKARSIRPVVDGIKVMEALLILVILIKR